MNDRLIISIGVGAQFAQGVQRLCDGLKANKYYGDAWLWTDYPRECPTHEDIPYGFKAWAVHRAMLHGYKRVLWMDSACVPVKPLTRLWYEIERDGCAFPWAHWGIGEWCSDAALDPMDITRDQVMSMRPSLWATVLGFDFTNAVTEHFVSIWHEKSLDGVSFHGGWTNDNGEVSTDTRVQGHRHDQTVATILAYRLGLPFNMNVVQYDAPNIMPLYGYKPYLRLPYWRTPILSNHNVKGPQNASNDSSEQRPAATA